MKHQLFPKELHGRFFLKSPKSTRPSAINFLIRFNSKLVKLTTHLKIYPEQWNQILQKAYISPILNPIDNHNNSIVNEKIDEIKDRFNKFKLYLCNIEKPEDSEVFKLIKEEFKDMARKKSKKEELNEFDDIVKVIHDTIYNDTTITTGTCDNYIKKGLPALKFYLSYLEKEENIRITSFKSFTTEFFTDFANYIHNNYTYGDGESYTITTINSLLKYAKSAIILSARAKKQLTEAEISSITIKLFTNKSAPNHIALRNDEVMLLYNYKATNKHDEEVRDLFLLECTFGHRISDILRLDQRLDKIGDKYYVTISPQKTPNKKIDVGIIFKIAKEILIDKYQCQLPSITKDKINKDIKRIAHEAGITGNELQSFHYQGEATPREFKRPRYECITSHTGRRTFISLLVARGWTYETISKYTGQSVKMVEHYDKATDKYIEIYKDSLVNRPYEIVQLCDEKNFNNNPKQDLNTPITSMENILELLFHTKDLFTIEALNKNKVDVSALKKTAQITKFLEDINRAEPYKEQFLHFYKSQPKELKTELIKILKATILIDPKLNVLKIAVTTLQQLGLNCLYAHKTYKYTSQSARDAYILVTVTPEGNTIIQ